MNFNYDLTTWIDYFIGAFICCFGMILVGKILLNKTFKEIKSRLLLLIPLTIFTIINTLVFDNILKIFGSLIVVYIIFKYVLSEKNGIIYIYTFVGYLILMISDILFALSVSLFDYLFNYSFAILVTNSVFSNLIVCVISCIISLLLKNKIIYYIDKINKSYLLITIFQVVITTFIIISSINYLYIENWKFSYKFVLVIIIIFGSVLLTFTFINQQLKNKEVVEKHKMLEEYLKTSADLIEKYSSTVHKYKNNLIIIKGSVNSNISEANNYIDGILEKMEDKKYSWVKKINYISIDSIRYIIYYKLSKAEELNLKIFVNVSKDVEKINSKLLKSNELGHILDILGEYFDNAIYASNESNEKELNFDLYIANNELVFNISNTYKGEIDLNLISKNGYTTKGKGHGFGLYDIDKTIRNINILNNKYEIIDNYFVTTLKVKLKDIKKDYQNN